MGRSTTRDARPSAWHAALGGGPASTSGAVVSSPPSGTTLESSPPQPEYASAPQRQRTAVAAKPRVRTMMEVYHRPRRLRTRSSKAGEPAADRAERVAAAADCITPPSHAERLAHHFGAGAGPGNLVHFRGRAPPAVRARRRVPHDRPLAHRPSMSASAGGAAGGRLPPSCGLLAWRQRPSSVSGARSRTRAAEATTPT